MDRAREWECPQCGHFSAQVEDLLDEHERARHEVDLLRRWIAAFGPDTACIDVDAVLTASLSRVPEGEQPA